MARYKVQAPNGGEFEFEAPDDATPAQLDAMSREAAGYAANYPVVMREPKQQPAPAPEPGLGEQFLSNFENDIAGVAQGRVAGLPDLAAKGLGQVLSAVPTAAGYGLEALGYDQAGEQAHDIARQLANPFQLSDAIEQIAPTPDTPEGRAQRFIAQLVGGAMLPAGALENVAARIVGEVPRLAETLPAIRPLTEEQELLKAAGRQGVDVLPADVGGPVTRRMTSAVSQTVGGTRPIKQAATRMTEQAKNARDRIAAVIGQALEPEAAGQAAIKGAKAAIKTTGDEADRFYKMAEKLTVGERVDAPKAVAVLDRNIAELGETPGGAPGLSILQSLRDDLAKGKLTVGGIRRMRTVLRDQFMKEGLTASDIERRVNQVVKAAAEDVTDGLKARGLDNAANLFAKGDAAWRNRMQLIDEVLEPIIGKDGTKSGEQVMKTLTADLQGNNARAARFLEALPEAEQSNVRASIIGALGKAKAGQQGAEGTEFSLNTFLTHWNQVGKTARRAYFGPEAQAALDDLAKIAEGTREAQGYRNLSNTGGVVAGLATAATGFGGFPLLVKTIGTQYALGRLLASPRFARWLARAPRAANQGLYIRKLSAIAAAEPAIRNDVLGLQQRLADAFGTVPAKATASGNEDNGQMPQ